MSHCRMFSVWDIFIYFTFPELCLGSFSLLMASTILGVAQGVESMRGAVNLEIRVVSEAVTRQFGFCANNQMVVNADPTEFLVQFP